MKTKIYSIVCVICLVLSFSFVLSSCQSNAAVGIEGAQINENGELILIYSDGTEQNLGVVVGKDGADGKNGADGADGKDGANGTDGSHIITSEESNIPLASAKGLRSAVSIVCNFQATVQQGGWRPGSGSTTTKSYSSSGSGVIYKMDKAEGDAFIITNYHVVYDASSNTENGISNDISVYLYDSEIEEKAIEATYVGGSLYYYGTNAERVQRALLGITVSASDSKAVFDSLSGLIKIEETVCIYEVSSGSLADGVLQEGDILVSATVGGNKTDITRQYHIIDMMLDVRAGDVVTLEILRSGEKMNVSITVTEDCLTEY